ATGDALHAAALEIPWHLYLASDGTFRVDAQTSESALDHSHFVEQRVKDAVADAFRARHGVRPSVDLETPHLWIHVHLFRDRRSPLLDPFCGSGTILVEAALLAEGSAPGSFGRPFGFETWPGHDAEAW